MARSIEFSKRATSNLKKIVLFYDQRNGNKKYSSRIVKELLQRVTLLAEFPEAGSPSTRKDVRFFYFLDFVGIYHYNSKRILVTSIRSMKQKQLKLYIKTV